MPYNSQIARTDAQALVPEEISSVMLENVVNASAALTMFRRVPISVNQVRMPVLSALPVAYFVNGDTGLKQTTKMAWENKYFNVEEIAAIVPAPEAVVEDTSFDIWEAVRPSIEDAIARALDAAIFFGVNKPGSWPADVVSAATAVGNTFEQGTSTAAQGGIAEDISQLFGLVEEEGYDVSGVIARTTIRRLIRGARDTTGQKHSEVTVNDWWGVGPINYPMRGLWPTGAGDAVAIAGDFSRGLLGVRADINYKVLDQAVIQDNSGAIIFNLAQQDMVALRVVARYAFQVSNPINYDEASPDARYPFGILTAPGS